MRPRWSAASTRARAKLLAIRSKRVWPGLDDKILTSWNALAIRGLAIAARALEQARLRAAADARARLRARATCGVTGGCSPPRRTAPRISTPTSTTTRTSPTHCSRCSRCAGATRTRPGCARSSTRCSRISKTRELGGFFFTSDDHEALIHRSKSFSDDAIPAGNGIAARVLMRAGYLLGETRWLEAAERTLRAAWLALNRFPHGHMSLLEALDEYLTPPEIVIIRGDDGAGSWQRELGKLYAPHRLVFAIPAELEGLDAAIADKKPGSGDARLCVPRLHVLGAGGIAQRSDSHGAGAGSSAAAAALPGAPRRFLFRGRFLLRKAFSLCGPWLGARCQRHRHGLARPGHQRLGVFDDVGRHLVIAHRAQRPIRGTA